MNYFSSIIIHFCLLITAIHALNHDIRKSDKCGPDVETCRYSWVVSRIETMILYENGTNGFPLVIKDNVVYRHTKQDCATLTAVTEKGSVSIIFVIYLLFQIKKTTYNLYTIIL